MGDHFVLLVDRLLTESTLEAAIESRNMSQQATPSAVQAANVDLSSHKIDLGKRSSKGKLVECRICHDEDEDLNMETPCSCCGSLKYAHRRCIQRWCNEKGDTNCEICHQQFKPGYTAPPQLFHYGGIPMNFRGNWEISRRDLHNPRFIAMVATDRNFLTSEYDEYSVPTSRSLICCRIVAIIFTILLVLRHTLPIMISGAHEYSSALLMVRLGVNRFDSVEAMSWTCVYDRGLTSLGDQLLLLRTSGIILPVYIILRAVAAMHHR